MSFWHVDYDKYIFARFPGCQRQSKRCNSRSPQLRSTEPEMPRPRRSGKADNGIKGDLTQKSRPERSLGGIMDRQWTNAVCEQRKKPVNCAFTDSALVEVTGLEPTAPTSRKRRWRCCDLLRFNVFRSFARFAWRAPAVFWCGLVRFRAGC